MTMAPPDPDCATTARRARRYGRRLLRGLVATWLFGVAGVAQAASIGTAEKVVLDVRSVMPAGERQLVVNADVFKEDTVETRERSATRLVFRDDTYLSMGPNSRVRIADLPVAQDDDRPFVVEAAHGVFKFVSGRLRSDRYRIETPAGTIGVRGTIVWLYVDEAGNAEVASQVGEVRPCAMGMCQDLTRGEYSRMRIGEPPTPPGPVPAAFYERIRDMVARLMVDGLNSGGQPVPTAIALDDDLDTGEGPIIEVPEPPRLTRRGRTGPGVTFGDVPPEPAPAPARGPPPVDGSQPPGVSPPQPVVPVPLPGTGILLGAGLALACLVGLFRRARHAATIDADRPA